MSVRGSIRKPRWYGLVVRVCLVTFIGTLLCFAISLLLAILGIAAFIWLTDRPEHATWLRPEQRSWLAAKLAGEAKRAPRISHPSVWRIMSNKYVLILALVYVALAIALLSSSGLDQSLLGGIQDKTFSIPALPLGLTLDSLSVTPAGIIGTISGNNVPFGS